MQQHENYQHTVILHLCDFRLQFNHDGRENTSFRMLTHKLRSKNKVAFSNRFETVKEIDLSCHGEIYDVRISVRCSCILVLTANSKFIVIDYLTHQILKTIPTECFYYVIEEDYDGMGNDALLTNLNGVISKYDLKRFIEERQDCELWKYKIPYKGYCSEYLNWMNLNSKHVVVVFSGDHIHFINSALGMIHDTGIQLEKTSSISACLGINYSKSNTIYFSDHGNLTQYELMDDGNWIATKLSNIENTEVAVDKVSGNLYCSGIKGISVYTNTGSFITFHRANSSDLCIDERTGFMYVGFGTILNILK